MKAAHSSRKTRYVANERTQPKQIAESPGKQGLAGIGTQFITEKQQGSAATGTLDISVQSQPR